MDTIFISIITITYNDLKGLIKTIDSIDKYFKPTNNYINHVIIDGNSMDGTFEFLEKIVTSRSIKTNFLSEPDLGIYDAMNKGVLNSSADFVIFINSGDVLLSDFFDLPLYHRLLNILENKKYAGLALNCIYNFNGNKIIIKSRDVNLLMPRMPSLHQGIIYKRSVLSEIPYSLYFKICGDFENICRIIKKYKFDTLNINISELFAGGISTAKPISLIKESYLIYITNCSPSLFNKLIYISRISVSLLAVQILFISSKIIPKIISKS
jgi:putative colanic acid biosynthesis glycosyltransferase